MKKHLLIILLIISTSTVFTQPVNLYNIHKDLKNGYIEYVETCQTFNGNFRPSKTFQFYFSKEKEYTKINLLNTTDSTRYVYDGRSFYTINYKNKTILIDTSKFSPFFNGITSPSKLPGVYVSMNKNLFNRYNYQKELSTKENQVFRDESIILYQDINNSEDSVLRTKELIYSSENKSIIKLECKEDKFKYDSVQIRTFIVEFSDFNNPKYNESKIYSVQKYHDEFEIKYSVSYEEKQKQLKAMVNTTAPDFEASVVGQPDSTMKLSDYKGKWVLLDFWFMGCKPCIALFPKVEELYHNYHAKGFEVIGINDIDKNSQKLADFVKDKNIPYITLNAEDRKVSEMYHVTGYPTFVLINPKQMIVEVGHITEVIEVLKKHLK